MDKEQLFLERLLKAEKIAGSLKKLSELSNVNQNQICRVKSSLSGNKLSDPIKRKTFSLNNLIKLADAINEDITFFTDENYILRENRKNLVHIENSNIKPFLLEIIEIYNTMNDTDKGYITFKLEKLLLEYKTICRERERDRENEIENIKKTS